MKLASTACFLATMAAAASNISTGTGNVPRALSELDSYYVDNMTATVSNSHYYQTLMSQDKFTSLTRPFVRATGLLVG